jgi:hypothetical protein
MYKLQAAKSVLGSTPVAAATNAVTARIDTAGAQYATILIPLGIELNTNSTNVIVNILDSDDTIVTNFVSLGTTLVDNTAAIVVKRDVPLKGRKRYLRVVVTPDTTTNGVVLIGGIIAMMDVDLSPVTNSTENQRLV